MIYRVLLDGSDILDYKNPDYTLLSPFLQMEVNTAGSFEFTLPPNHPLYSALNPITSTVEVYEDEELLWFGRPVEIRTDYFTQKKVYCEGALAFFNDSVQRPREFESVSLHSFFRTVIDSHNSQVAENRRFTVGQITIPDKTVYRKLNYDTTFDVLKKQCLNAEGGYLFVRREGGVNIIDWLSEMPYSCNQPVEFGLNLLDLSSGFDGSTIATCVIPLGETDAETGQPLTVESVNSGSDTIESEAAAVYGRITKAVQFPGVSDADTLYQEGLEYLSSRQFDDLVIECSAAELHRQNPNFELFRLGQMIRVHSVPHLIDKELPLIRLSLHLDTAAKQITLGTEARQSLTRIYKDAVEQETSETTEEPATREELENMETRIDGLDDQLGGLQNQVDGFDDQIGGLQNQIDVLANAGPGGDGWIHQIDGTTVSTGVINFVTVS